MRIFWAAAVPFVLFMGLFGSETTEVNMAPTAVVLVDGRPDFIHSQAELPHQIAEVANGGFYDTQYRAELPPGPQERHLTLRFPRPYKFRRLILLGSGDQTSCKMTFAGLESDGRLIPFAVEPDWRGRDHVAPSMMLEQLPAVLAIDVGMEGTDRYLVTCIHAFVEMPRWQAWMYATGLQLAGPWLVGAGLALAILGWGRLLAWPLQSFVAAERDALRLALGLAAMGFLGGACLCWPALIRIGWVQLALFVISAAPLFWELPIRLRKADRSFTLIVAVFALLLLSLEALDTTITAGRRAKPMDHLMGLYVPKHLFNESMPPFLFSLRPWLVGGLTAPLAFAAGTYAYWFYLGAMAWLNALTLLAVRPWFVRWHPGRPTDQQSALLALLPCLSILHFPGQRPLTAGLVLLAIYFWTSHTGGRVIVGGLLAGLAYLCHPGSLFLLPVAAVVLWLGAKRPLATIVLALAIPTLLHIGWSQYVHRLHPGERNDLAYYPIMKDFQHSFPREFGFFDAVRSLSWDDWKELAFNRIRQLRHYAWSDNPWHTEPGELFRPVSLITTVGLLGVAAIWRSRRSGTWQPSFLWMAVLGPLLCLHAHIGQSFPQFHIAPWPFVAFAMIVANSWRTLPSALRWLIVAESSVPILWPIVVVWRGCESPNGWFSYDTPSRFVFAAVPVLCWSLLADRVLRREEP